MQLNELAPGLWWWTSAHPAWKPHDDSPTGWPREVGSVSFEPTSGGGMALVDPLVPADEADARSFYQALDRDVARGGEFVIVLTNAWHGRSANELLARYREKPGCQVLAHADAATAVSADLTSTFDGDHAELPLGLRAHRLRACDGGECVIELPEGAGLVFGDALLGVAVGKVRTLPSSWTPEAGRENVQERLREQLRPLLDRPFARLLVSHGAPVLTEAPGALEDALGSPPKGS